jgi:hypothetical protein
MRRTSVLLMLALGAVPFAANAKSEQAGWPIPAGMSITMTVDTDTAKPAKVTGVGRATLSDADRAIAAKFTGGEYNWAQGPKSAVIESGVDGVPPLAEVQRGQVKFSFLLLQPPGHSLLIVENGYVEAIAYRAKITVKGKETATDVCIVIPQKRAYEHWPYEIEQIEVIAPARRGWSERDGVKCE